MARHNVKMLACWACAALLAVTPPAWGRMWQVDSTGGSLAFAAQCDTGTCSGVFRRVQADIAFDPDDIALSRFDITVDLASAVLDGRDADTPPPMICRDPDRFRNAYITTTLFHRMANGDTAVFGTVNLCGVIRPLVLRVAFARHGSGAVVRMTGQLAWSSRGATRMFRNGVTLRGHWHLQPQAAYLRCKGTSDQPRLFRHSGASRNAKAECRSKHRQS
ncbi:MAG TPA: YceI family protein [Rhodanobacteraceae bacterium]